MHEGEILEKSMMKLALGMQFYRQGKLLPTMHIINGRVQFKFKYLSSFNAC